MVLTPELLDLLACPDCRGKLELHKNQTLLTCVKCGEKFEVRDGIPVLMGKKK